jgi:phospholipid/cholesterol/gamma-HCH transport system ATP-binding protein
VKKSSVPGAGFVFEYGGLLSNMTVFNNVALPLRYHTDLSQERIASEVYAILAKLRMMVFADEIPARLSLGTRKLASIARAIAMRPQIIYYDEPTLGLDRAAARAVETVMRETCKEHGVTSVAVTHDVELGCRFADRVVILGDGVMRGIGTPAELAASRDPRIQSYLARE